MKVLIVYAHPEPQSFNGAMKDLAVEVLTSSGHKVQVSDLYAMKFDPVGGPADFLDREDPSCFRYQREQIHAHKKQLFAPEIQEEMEKLIWADFVLFQFPLWWFSLPAILKGWVDRVFAMGFSYDIGASYDRGFFTNKRGMLAVTTGAPEQTYGLDGRNGDMHALLVPINRGMLHYLGLQVLPPFVAYSAARVSPEQRAEYLNAFRDRLLTIDSTSPLRLDLAYAR